jgi:long-chain acyl-CoA synthetase
MSIYSERPWLDRYDPGQPADIDVEFVSALAMFEACVARNPDAPIIRYLGGVLTRRELDELSGAFAAALANAEFAAGERVALYLQNVPQFVIAMLGAWKAGGIAVAVNPMNKKRELEEILRDSGAAVLVCHEDLYQDVASQVVGGTDVQLVITTSALDYQTRGQTLPAGTLPAVPPLGPDDVAFLTYTSGTTGPPKGAMTTHRNIVFNAQTYRDWIGIGPRDVILGVAPLFHITGSIGHVALSLLTRGDRPGPARRRAAHRRRRLHGSRRLVLPRRPEKGPDQCQRL